jgi:hypothetical protein
MVPNSDVLVRRGRTLPLLAIASSPATPKYQSTNTRLARPIDVRALRRPKVYHQVLARRFSFYLWVYFSSLGMAISNIFTVLQASIRSPRLTFDGMP